MRCACRCEAIKILEGLSSDRQRQPFRLEIGAFGILKKMLANGAKFCYTIKSSRETCFLFGCDFCFLIPKNSYWLRTQLW